MDVGYFLLRILPVQQKLAYRGNRSASRCGAFGESMVDSQERPRLSPHETLVSHHCASAAGHSDKIDSGNHELALETAEHSFEANTPPGQSVQSREVHPTICQFVASFFSCGCGPSGATDSGGAQVRVSQV
jgi:hypothetical protein